MRNKATLIERKADGHRAPILQLKQFWGDKETLSEEVSILLRPDGWWQVSVRIMPCVEWCCDVLVRNGGTMLTNGLPAASL